jgi:hypothetical protein
MRRENRQSFFRTIYPQTEKRARQYGVQIFGSRTENTPYTFVDRPKTSLRIVSVLVWSVSAFLLYKAIVESAPNPWILWGALAIFAVCCYSLVHEFMLRPTRVTTIHPLERQVVVQETAAWRKKKLGASISPGIRFEVFQCESDNSLAHGVRIKSPDNGWLTIAEYVSAENAERLARQANFRLLYVAKKDI